MQRTPSTAGCSSSPRPHRPPRHGLLRTRRRHRRRREVSVTEEQARRPGRPRSVEADEAILEAAVDLFAAGGLDGLTVEGVAARAGVG